VANTFDRIITSAPLNASASRVTARGEHWVPETQMPPGLKHWKAPPSMEATPSPAFDLTGKKFGRFTVLGLSTERASDGARWICRCVCGDFEARSAKTIKAALAGLAPEDTLSFQCYYCYAWKAVQRQYKKKGAKPISAFINPAKRALQHQTPEAVIADLVGGHEPAVKIIAMLNRSGFRVVRGEKSGILTAPALASDQ
jgi:hypothetical protein